MSQHSRATHLHVAAHQPKVERHAKALIERFRKVRIQLQNTQQVITMDLVQRAVGQPFDNQSNAIS